MLGLLSPRGDHSRQVVAFAVVFVTRGVTFVRALPPLVAPSGELRKLAERGLAEVHANPAAVFAHVETQAVSLESRAAGFAASIVGATFAGLLTVLFMSLRHVPACFLRRFRNEIVNRAELDLPLNPRHLRAYLGQFRKVGSDVLRGTVVSGAIQGALAGLGYWACGLPDPAFFGALTAAASIVPAVGTALVWIGAGGLISIATASCLRTAAVAELFYRALVVGILTDYVNSGRGSTRAAPRDVPAVLTFSFRLFGGVEVFGVVGPDRRTISVIVTSLSIAVLEDRTKRSLAHLPTQALRFTARLVEPSRSAE